ncbi:MAG: YegP family protein [Phycisphaerales bacterium]|nr:YegP family protein [Phycisphaerales bacterium]
MATGRFLISRDANGAFRWVLRDGEGATVAESTEGFAEHRACSASLDRLRKTAAKAEVIDLTMPAKVIKPRIIPASKPKRRAAKKKSTKK